jgi:glycosyltransferase involved in cell wall biosynthesis
VIAVSDAIRRDLAHHYGRRAPTVVIPHAVDTAQFNPGDAARARSAARADYGLDDDAFVILYVGDLRKGAAHVIETAARVPGTMVLLVSRTDPRPYLEQALTLGLEGRVIAAGPTDTVERAYAAADVFLFPTPYDAFGMVITEAMASGLPVITTRDAGASELITHETDGLLLDRNDDVPAMAAWVTALRDDSSRRGALGRAAAARAATFTWDEVAQRTLAVYERTLETRGAAPPRR